MAVPSLNLKCAGAILSGKMWQAPAGSERTVMWLGKSERGQMEERERLFVIKEAAGDIAPSL